MELEGPMGNEIAYVVSGKLSIGEVELWLLQLFNNNTPIFGYLFRFCDSSSDSLRENFQSGSRESV